MRFSAALLGLVGFVGLSACLSACNGRPITDSCPTAARTGSAPSCVLTAQCKATNVGVTLDCSANNGSCICSENGVIGATVTYQSDFCEDGDASDVTTFEPALESANSACKWNLQ